MTIKGAKLSFAILAIEALALFAAFLVTVFRYQKSQRVAMAGTYMTDSLGNYLTLDYSSHYENGNASGILSEGKYVVEGRGPHPIPQGGTLCGVYVDGEIDLFHPTGNGVEVYHKISDSAIYSR